MEIILAIAGFAFVATAFVSGFFLLVVQPIWGIIDAAVSEKLSSGAKVAIILPTILVLGPLMTFFYALLGSHSRPFKQLTVIAGVLFAASLVGALAVAALSPNSTGTLAPEPTANAVTAGDF